MTAVKKLNKAQQILLRITTNAREHQARVKANLRTQTAIFADTFLWVVEVLSTGEARNKQEAFTRLSKAVNKSSFTVGGWYACGQMMNEHGITRAANSGALQRLLMHRQQLTDVQHHRCILAIKNEGDRAPSIIVRITERSKEVQEAIAVRHATALLEHDKLTLTQVRMEMMAAGTTASAHFQEAVTIQVVSEGGKVLTKIDANYWEEGED